MPSLLDTFAADIQKRLADPRLPFARRLAELLVENALESPVEKLVPLDEAVEAIRNGVHDHFQSDGALKALTGELGRAIQPLERSDQTLRELLPKQVADAIRAWLREPWQPQYETLLALLDHGPGRELLRKLMQATLLEFSVTGDGPGLGRKLRRLGEGAKGPLGSLLGDVGHELGKKVEERIEAFAENAVLGTLRQLGRELSDPKRHDFQVELRLATFEGLLSLTGRDLADELERADLLSLAGKVRKAFARWLETGDGARDFDALVRRIVEPNWSRQLGDIVKEVGLWSVVNEHAPRILEQRVRAFAESPKFATFVRDLALGGDELAAKTPPAATKSQRSKRK